MKNIQGNNRTGVTENTHLEKLEKEHGENAAKVVRTNHLQEIEKESAAAIATEAADLKLAFPSVEGSINPYSLLARILRLEGRL